MKIQVDGFNVFVAVFLALGMFVWGMVFGERQPRRVEGCCECTATQLNRCGR